VRFKASDNVPVLSLLYESVMLEAKIKVSAHHRRSGQPVPLRAQFGLSK